MLPMRVEKEKRKSEGGDLHYIGLIYCHLVAPAYAKVRGVEI